MPPPRRDAVVLQSSLAPARAFTLRAHLPCLPPIASAAAVEPPASSSRLTSAQRRLSALLCNHKGMGVTDWCWRERIANVATSLPFFALGARFACAADAPAAARSYGVSLLGVGAAAVLYHTSAGGVRPHWRQLDYITIGTASWCLLGALQPRPRPPALAAVLGAGLVAAHPLAAAAAHASAAEAIFAARAAAKPALRLAHRTHLATSALAATLFVAEEVWPEVPLLHAAWHCAAASALAGFGAVIPLTQQ